MKRKKTKETTEGFMRLTTPDSKIVSETFTHFKPKQVILPFEFIEYMKNNNLKIVYDKNGNLKMEELNK